MWVVRWMALIASLLDWMDKAIESLTPLHVVCALCVHVCAEMIKGSFGGCHGYRNLWQAVWQL